MAENILARLIAATKKTWYPSRNRTN
jgi:hypothetical protein